MRSRQTGAPPTSHAGYIERRSGSPAYRQPTNSSKPFADEVDRGQLALSTDNHRVINDRVVADDCARHPRRVAGPNTRRLCIPRRRPLTTDRSASSNQQKHSKSSIDISSGNRPNPAACSSLRKSTGIPPIQQPPTPKREFPYRSSPNPRSALRSPCIVEELRFKGILGAPFDPTHR